MPAFEGMDDRSVIRALMRGDRATLKTGYTDINAVLALLDQRPEENLIARNKLYEYALGFGDGLKEKQRPPYPSQQYISGHLDGVRENADDSCQPG